MKFIHKNTQNEPPSLEDCRTTPGSNFDSCNKNDMRVALIEEQGNVCAYCNQRINNETDEKGKQKMKIEHWEPRNSANEMQWNNLLGVCLGNLGSPSKIQHCDTKKGNTSIQISPLNQSLLNQIKYRANGEIYSENKNLNIDLSETLNLNFPLLVNQRKAVLNSIRINIKQTFRKRKVTTAFLNTEIRRWEERSNGKFNPFCDIAVFYLNNKLRQI